MNKTRFAAVSLAALFLLTLCSCHKETPEKPYKPYDFDLASYIKLGDILGVRYTPVDTSVTEEEVDLRLCRALDELGFFETEEGREEALTEGNVRLGDEILFSSTATVDGADYPDAATENRTVTVGERQVLLDNFDAALVGIPLGTPTTLSLTFPSDYADFSLRRKEILLTVTVHEVKKRLTLPEAIPQEWLEKLTDLPFTDYYESLRQTLIEEKEAYAQKKKTADCWMAALDEVTLISYPQSEMERYVAEYLVYTEKQGMAAGFATLADYEKSLGITDDELRDRGMNYARGDVLQEMVVYAVSKNEGFDKMSDELFDRYALRYAEELGLDSVALLTDTVGYDAVQKRVLTEVVKQYIADNAKPNEETEISTLE